MNPLTLVKRIQNINSKEADLGISEQASWHAKYKDSAYVFVGGIPFDLTEGDLLAVFAQYGEIVDVNLVRDKGTGKSKGFAFIAYEDQRSTNLAVDNLNGAQILGRIIRVDHVSNYKKKEEEDEEEEQRKREERGVCRAFQRGECTRGAGCKFSHDEQRAANTGWGAKEDRQSRWVHDKVERPEKHERRPGQSTHVPESASPKRRRYHDEDLKNNREKRDEIGAERHHKRSEQYSREDDHRRIENRMERKEKQSNLKEDRIEPDKRFGRHDDVPKSREDRDRRDEPRSRKHDSDTYHREDRGSRGDRRSAREQDLSPPNHKRSEGDRGHRSHR